MFEEGKCYKITKENGEEYLFKYKEAKRHPLDNRYMQLEVEKSILIHITDNNQITVSMKLWGYIDVTNETVEIDETLLDKVIKMFKINTNSMLALINEK